MNKHIDNENFTFIIHDQLLFFERYALPSGTTVKMPYYVDEFSVIFLFFMSMWTLQLEKDIIIGYYAPFPTEHNIQKSETTRKPLLFSQRIMKVKRQQGVTQTWE